MNDRQPPLRPPTLVALALIVVGAFALGRYAAPRPAPPPEAVTAVDTAVAASAVATAVAEPTTIDPRALPAGSGGSATATATAALPLPPPDAPLAEVIDVLEDRARRGDVRAACRLGKALGRCHDLNRRGMRNISDEQIAGMLAFANQPSEQQERELRRLLRERETALALDRYCADIDRGRSRQAIRHTLQAALAGHRDSIRAIADGDAIRHDDLIAEPQLAQLLHQHRLPMIVAMLRAGDRNALHNLHTALMSMSESERLRLPADLRSPQTIDALRELIQLVVRTPEAELPRLQPRGLSPEALAAAAGSPVREAELARMQYASAAYRLYEAHFADSAQLVEARALHQQQRGGSIPIQAEEIDMEDYFRDDCEAEWPSESPHVFSLDH